MVVSDAGVPASDCACLSFRRVDLESLRLQLRERTPYTGSDADAEDLGQSPLLRRSHGNSFLVRRQAEVGRMPLTFSASSMDCGD